MTTINLHIASVIDAESPLKPDVVREKFGVVVINNADGSHKNSYEITASQMDSVHEQGTSDIPPGCTQEEWESGRAAMYGKERYEVGDLLVMENGFLKLVIATTAVNGIQVPLFMRLMPSDYTGQAPNISVANIPNTSPAGVVVVSIDNGVMETVP